MNGQEAQQAQTIARIKGNRGGYTAIADRKSLLEIVDSRAQKIAEITALLRAEHGRTDEQAQKIAEQAKEIERLYARIAAMQEIIDEAG